MIAIKTLQKYRKIIIYAFFISLAIYGAVYFLIVNGRAYEVAREFVGSSSEIELQIGQVKRTSLQPFPLKINVSGNSGNAEFQINAMTASGDKHRVVLNLTKKTGQWSVVSASLDDRVIL